MPCGVLRLFCGALPCRWHGCLAGLGWWSSAAAPHHQGLYLRHWWQSLTVRYFLYVNCVWGLYLPDLENRPAVCCELCFVTKRVFSIPCVDWFFVCVYCESFWIQPLHRLGFSFGSIQPCVECFLFKLFELCGTSWLNAKPGLLRVLSALGSWPKPNLTCTHAAWKFSLQTSLDKLVHQEAARSLVVGRYGTPWVTPTDIHSWCRRNSAVPRETAFQ